MAPPGQRGAAVGTRRRLPDGRTSPSVTWVAPNEPESFTPTLTVDDRNDANEPADEGGRRDDPARQFTVTVNVVSPDLALSVMRENNFPPIPWSNQWDEFDPAKGLQPLDATEIGRFSRSVRLQRGARAPRRSK